MVVFTVTSSILTLIYINDMDKSNLLSNFHFADDSTGLAKGSNIVEVGNFVNTELQKLKSRFFIQSKPPFLIFNFILIIMTSTQVLI